MVSWRWRFVMFATTKGDGWRRWLPWIMLLICLQLSQAEDTSQEQLKVKTGEWFNFPWSKNNTYNKGNGAAGGVEGVQLRDDYGQVDVSNFRDFENHPCRRVCQQGQSMTCYYQMVVHKYQRLGPECQRCPYDERACAEEHCIYGDGVPTPIMAVNRMVPAPTIELCENDTVIVDVLNYLEESTTMHWHGVHMKYTPHMDGVPYVTQHPIEPTQVYRYKYIPRRTGTLWYHSHSNWQRALGVAGLFIIRQPHQTNPHAYRYDYDLAQHAIIIQDILYEYNFDQVRNILINGMGRNHLNQLPDSDSRHRYARQTVTGGKRYLMRVVLNGVFNCPIEFSIENHKLLIVSADGNDIEPVLADGFFLTSAERFDFVLEANQYPKNYWIRVRGYGQCEGAKLYQGAVLSYRGAARSDLPQGDILVDSQARDLKTPPPVYVNDFRYKFNNNSLSLLRQSSADRDVGTVSLRSLEPMPWPRYTKFQTYYTSLSRAQAPNGEQIFKLDDIGFDLPLIPLLQALNIYPTKNECNRTSLIAQGRDCSRETCQCVHIIRLPAYKPIELIVYNLMEPTHPIHIHGFTFRLVGQGVLGNLNDLRNIRELDRRGRLPRLPDDYAAVAKDTVQVPGLGYVIMRFISDNPGYWSYHCHIEAHSVLGMTAVLKVGEDYQIKKAPVRVQC